MPWIDGVGDIALVRNIKVSTLLVSPECHISYL
jgi:hypothetical protein